MDLNEEQRSLDFTSGKKKYPAHATNLKSEEGSEPSHKSSKSSKKHIRMYASVEVENFHQYTESLALKGKSTSVNGNTVKQHHKSTGKPDENSILKEIYSSAMNGDNLVSVIKKAEKLGGTLVYDLFTTTIFKFNPSAKEDRYSLLHRALKEFKKPRILRGFNSEKSGACRSPKKAPNIEKGNEELIESLSEKERIIYMRNQALPRTRNFPKNNEINTYIDELSLLFDSNFESGNLRRVYKISDYEYNLVLDFDMNTDSYSQWYFFSVSNIKKDHKIKLNIINLSKENSLYNEGFKPVFYSVKSNLATGMKWFRGGENISYTKNEKIKVSNGVPSGGPKKEKKDKPKKSKIYFTLSFSFTFHHEFDTVYIAHCYPFTYSDLNEHLNKVTVPKKFCRLEKFSETIVGNSVYLLTINESEETRLRKVSYDQTLSPKKMPSPKQRDSIRQREILASELLKINLIRSGTNDKPEFKPNQGNHIEISREETKALSSEETSIKSTDTSLPKSIHEIRNEIVIFSRVHPGESNSSWIMKGMIDYLVSNHPIAQLLRTKYVFKIFPMINPDGVRFGNYRCCLFGVDNNRKWVDPHPLVNSQIYEIKKYLSAHKDKIHLLLDIHGHSKLKNAFMYGNNYVENESKDQSDFIKIFPFLLCCLSDLYSFEKCKFNITKDKMGTMRVALFQEFKIPNCYTLEASLMGSEKKTPNPEIFNWGTDDYELIGREFIQTLYLWDNKEIYNEAFGILRESDREERFSLLKTKLKNLTRFELIETPLLKKSQMSVDKVSHKPVAAQSRVIVEKRSRIEHPISASLNNLPKYKEGLDIGIEEESVKNIIAMIERPQYAKSSGQGKIPLIMHKSEVKYIFAPNPIYFQDSKFSLPKIETNKLKNSSLKYKNNSLSKKSEKK